MPRDISGLRVARSWVTPTGAEVVSRELDFQLATRQGIRIHGVLGHGTYVPPINSTFGGNNAHQTLHLETGTLEQPPDSAAEDADNIDTEIFWRQDFSVLSQDEAATRGGSAAGFHVLPTGMITFPIPILSARNITHRGETLTANEILNAGVLIYYNYVEFSLAEMGFLLSRRA